MTTHAKAIIQHFANKHCDIYVSEHTGKVLYSDHELEQLSLIRGTVIEAVGPMLVVMCNITTAGSGDSVKVLINGWSIVSIMEHKDNISLLQVMSVDEQRKFKR